MKHQPDIVLTLFSMEEGGKNYIEMHIILKYQSINVEVYFCLHPFKLEKLAIFSVFDDVITQSCDLGESFLSLLETTNDILGPDKN